MILSFNINYHTRFGEQIYLVGSIPELGLWQTTMAREMYPVGDGNWRVEIELPDYPLTIEYRYFVRAGEMIHWEEWDQRHRVMVDNFSNRYTIFDYWRIAPAYHAFYTSAFTQSLFAPTSGFQLQPTGSNKKLTIRIFAPQVERHEYVAITGNQAILGNWQPAQAVRMDSSSFPEWTIQLDANQIIYPMEYKFLILDKEQQQAPYWETGENRFLFLPLQQPDEEIIVSNLFLRDERPLWKGTGTVIPVFSLRSENSFGVGDLDDLKIMVDWAKKTRQRIIQILPVNDTTMTLAWADSYPYSAISIYALHPIYISIRGLGPLKDHEKALFFKEKQMELNEMESLDYEAVIHHKLAYCKAWFDQEKEEIIHLPDFKEFVEQNSSWLIPYAAFCYLRFRYNTSDFNQWEEFAIFNKPAVYQLCKEESGAYPEILFTFYLQYILHKQFKAVSDHARENGVVLKGDLPIGINRTSVEAWVEPEYFNMKGQAGAPPDDFSVVGQNWMFPTYNWDLMEQDGYSWWKKRFRKLEDYFDCFRIDHILGFFRIWEIPLDYIQGLCGHFNPALPLAREEIEAWGISFDETCFTIPRIHKDFLPELFGDLATEVKDSYLAQATSDYFVLKPFCDTQRKIDTILRDKTDDFSFIIRNGLFTITNEVLFLRDPYQKDKFHPRIAGNQSYLYRKLSEADRVAFDKLHEDFFYHRHNEFWKETALKRLTPLVTDTDILVCGEDLGMIPQSVPEVMNQLQILSLEIERMPKAPYREFTDMRTLPYLSVCTTSTHDMDPLRNWWKENPEKTQRYYNQVLQREGKAPEECTAEIATQILSNHLLTHSMLTIIPLQDWFATNDRIKNKKIESERINVPANPRHYWRYRMHIPLEKLLEADDFNQHIISLIEQSGRK
ncbi:MAG: 4-alpha-glucanotransferase [Tannerellaceae bacterium]|nr:4-alpha-glucanotransferase [Tannerellaceae bacterium]